MANLIAKSALHGQDPLTLLDTILAEVAAGQITSIAPFPGREGDVAKALGGFPDAGQMVGNLVWTGRAQAFLIGADCPDLGDMAAVTDQTSGWVTLSLTGPAAVDVLARYVPIDLRLSAFPVGSAARSQLFHVPLILMRHGDQDFHLMTFRSMARTAWHEVVVAMKTLAARAI